MNSAKNICGINIVSDEDALRKANLMSVDEQNYRFSSAARDIDIFKPRSVLRIRLVGGHAVPMMDPEAEPIVSALKTDVVEVSSLINESSTTPRVRAGRGYLGMNKKRRENYRS